MAEPWRFGFSEASVISPCKPPVGLLGGIAKASEKPNLQELIQQVRAAKVASDMAERQFAESRGQARTRLGEIFQIANEHYSNISAMCSWLGIRWDADLLNGKGDYFIDPKFVPTQDPAHIMNVFKERLGKPKGFPGHSLKR